MATIKIEIVAGAQTDTHTRTLTGPHLIRFIAAVRTHFSMDPALTDAQVLAFWAQKVFDDGKAIVKQVERGAAIKAAGDGVTDIAMT